MTVADYTPHFAVVGGPAPHPAGDGRMGVVLVASKAIKDVEILEEVLEHPPWSRLFDLPPEYKTQFVIKLDHRVNGFIYHVFWAEDYSGAWEVLFNEWGRDIVPDNQEMLEQDQRKAIG